MPLKKGRSRKTVSHNVREMVDTWKRSGKIGNSRPRSKKKAVKQAVAISLKKAGKSKYQAKKKKPKKARRYLKLVHPARFDGPAVYSKLMNL